MVTFCATLPAVQDAVPVRAIVELPIMVARVVLFTSMVPDVVIVPPFRALPAMMLVTVPCGGVMHWLVVPLVVVVTFCATVAPAQEAVPAFAALLMFSLTS